LSRKKGRGAAGLTVALIFLRLRFKFDRPTMNQKQRILTCVSVLLFVFSLFFVPWRVEDRAGGHYEFSPYWQPVLFDEGGVLRPVILYLEWGILGVSYAVLYACLRNKKNQPQQGSLNTPRPRQ
jgi:hypothetical protein